MRVYLARHGEAKNEGDDRERPLSEKGLSDVEKAGRFMAGTRAVKICHSGRKRAEMTASVLAKNMGVPSIEEAQGLSPMDDPAPWRKRLDEEGEDLMLVGHLPFMGRLASLLLAGDSEKDLIDFKAGSVLCLEKTSRGWAVAWMVAPEVLR